MLHNFVFVFWNKFKIRSTVGPIRRLMLLVQCRRHRHHSDPIKKKKTKKQISRLNFFAQFWRWSVRVTLSTMPSVVNRNWFSRKLERKKKTKIAGQQKRKTTQITSNDHLIFLCFQTHTAKSKFGLFVSFGNFLGNEEIVKCFFFLLLKWDIQLSSRWCGCCYF